MFPRAYFAGNYFAPEYFPAYSGSPPPTSSGPIIIPFFKVGF